MRRGSPFFLGTEDHRHYNLAEDIVECLLKLEFKVRMTEIASKVRVPKGLWDNLDVVKDWMNFLQIEKSSVSVEEVQRRLRVHITDGVDLNDAIIVGSKQG